VVWILGDERFIDIRNEVAGPVVLAVQSGQVRGIIRRIRGEAEAVERRQTFLPVGRVLVELPVLWLELANNRERPGPNRLLVRIRRRIVDLAPNMLWSDHRLADVPHDRCEDFLESEHDGLRIRRLD
jgi:hypothetical protein